jgi:hypothetical protein
MKSPVSDFSAPRDHRGIIHQKTTPSKLRLGMVSATEQLTKPFEYMGLSASTTGSQPGIEQRRRNATTIT